MISIKSTNGNTKKSLKKTTTGHTHISSVNVNANYKNSQPKKFKCVFPPSTKPKTTDNDYTRMTIDGISIKISSKEKNHLRMMYKIYRYYYFRYNRGFLERNSLNEKWLQYLKSHGTKDKYTTKERDEFYKDFLREEGFVPKNWDEYFNGYYRQQISELRPYIKDKLGLNYKELTMEQINKIRTSKAFSQRNNNVKLYNGVTKKDIETIKVDDENSKTYTVNDVKVRISNKEIDDYYKSYLYALQRAKDIKTTFNKTWDEYLNDRLLYRIKRFKVFLSEKLNMNYKNLTFDQLSSNYNSEAFKKWRFTIVYKPCKRVSNTVLKKTNSKTAKI